MSSDVLRQNAGDYTVYQEPPLLSGQAGLQANGQYSGATVIQLQTTDVGLANGSWVFLSAYCDIKRVSATSCLLCTATTTMMF